MSGCKIKKGSVNSPNFADNTIQSNCINQRYDYIPYISVDYINCLVIGLDIDHFKQNMDFTYYESKREDVSKFEYFVKDNIVVKHFVDSKQNRITLSGSLHKYFNDGLHNYDLFTHENYLKALERLKNEFAVEPENLYILTLEYGVNIKPPIRTKKILDNLFMHRHAKAESPINNKRGYYKQFKHDKYIIKAYDKAKQFKLKYELMRFEIKETNWSENRLKHGIKTLADFNKSDKTIFVNRLINKWDEIIFYDPTIKGLGKWDKYSNQNFWSDPNIKKQKSKHLKRLNNLIQNHSDNIKGQISNLILENIKEVQNSDLSKKRTCKLTGVDISQQQKKSFLLSHTGLKQLRETNYQAYIRLKDIFLPHRWETSSTQTQIKEIAHNIRSKYNYLQRHRPDNQLRLF